MAEESQEKKKSGPVKRIFKLIGLGLLALLLIAGLIFQAPWKLITLLAIILAACTVLPKPARKWFWLSAGVVVIALIIWVFLPEDDEGWRPYTFDKELAALEAKYVIPNEENAAFAYDEIFETLDIDSNQPEFFIKLKPSSKDEPWLTKDHPETAEWLKDKQKIIDRLIEISRIEKCKFSIPVGPASLDLSMKRLPQIRRSTFLLVSAANNDMAEGRIDAALEKCLCIIQMAKHLYQQPALIYCQVGIAIEALGSLRLNLFVIEAQPRPEQLQLVSTSLIGVENNWGDHWRKILDFEKLYAKNMLCGMVYEVDSEGKTRLTRRSFASTIGQSPQQLPTGTYSRRKCAKLGVIFLWLYVPSAPEKISEIVDVGYEKYYAMAEPEFDWNKEPSEPRPRWKVNYRSGIELLTSLPCPAYYRIHEIYLRNLEMRRGSRLLTAIKRYYIEHGSWPRSLDEIKPGVPAEAFIDPVSGGQFEYENHGKRFSLFGETVNIWPK